MAQQIEEILPSSTESGKQPTHQDVLKAILDLDLKQVRANFSFVCILNFPAAQTALSLCR